MARGLQSIRSFLDLEIVNTKHDTSDNLLLFHNSKGGYGMLTPIYDCASSLAPSLTDNQLSELLKTKRRLDRYIEVKPKISVRLPVEDKYPKLSYIDYLDKAECSIYLKNAFESILGRISLTK